MKYDFQFEDKRYQLDFDTGYIDRVELKIFYRLQSDSGCSGSYKQIKNGKIVWYDYDLPYISKEAQNYIDHLMNLMAFI